MKSINSLLAVLLYYFLFVSSFFLYAKTYTGTVVPIFSGNINAGSASDYWGTLNYTARTGEITEPQISTVSGHDADPGSALTVMKQKYWQGEVTEAEGELIAAKENLKIAHSDYLRYKKLAPSGAVTVKSFQEMRANFYEALGRYKAAEANLDKQKRVLQETKQIAPFEGVVNKVFYSSGILTGDPKVLHITQLNPIGINVEMTADEANSISTYTPVSIFVNGLKNPIGIYNGYSLSDKNGITFQTRNYPKYYSGKKFKIVDNYYPVTNFYINSIENKNLGIPIVAINKDDKGFFVWKAKNNKVMQQGKGFNPVFQIEKTYIKPGNLKRMYFGTIQMQILDDPGKLEMHDMIISDPNNSLKDGETVSLTPNRYILMPGDKVKVVIGDFNTKNMPTDTASLSSNSESFDDFKHHSTR